MSRPAQEDPPETGAARPAKSGNVVIRHLLSLIPAALLIGSWSFWATRPQATGAKAERVVEIEEALTQSPPEILFLGNSLVDRGIDAAGMERHLDLSEGRAQVVSLAGNGGAASYLQLKNRVYANGHRPRLVVVVHLLSYVLSLERPEGMDLNRLREESAVAEPVLARKLEGRSLPMQRLLERRARFRQDFLDGVRDVALQHTHYRGQAAAVETSGVPKTTEELHADAEGLDSNPGTETPGIETPDAETPDTETPDTVPDPEEVLRAHLHGQTTAALARVFADEALHSTSAGRMIPIVESVRTGDREPTFAVADSFVPELIDLAEEHGSRIVFVRPPVRPGVNIDRVPAAVVDDLVAYLNTRQAGFLDLSSVGYPATMFSDNTHLNQRGRAAFTRQVAERLQQIGALGEGPMQRAYAPLRTVATERREATGTVTQFPVEDGDLPWQLEPGSQLELSFAAAWAPERGDFRIRIAATQLGEGSLDLALEEESGAVQAWRLSGRRALRAELYPHSSKGPDPARPDPARPDPKRPWKLRLSNPKGGSAVQIDALEVGQGNFLVGGPGDMEPPTATLVGFGADRVTANYTAPPIHIATERQWHASEPDLVFMDVDDRLAHLGYAEITQRLGVARFCSPLRVRMNGEPLAGPLTFRTHVAEQGMGRYAHVDKLAIASTAQREPSREQEFTIFLDPRRQCRQMRWLYPRDRLQLRIAAEDLGPLLDGAHSLALQALTWPPHAAGASLVLRLAPVGAAVQDRATEGDGWQEQLTLQLDQLAEEAPVQLPLETALAGPSEALLVEVENRSDDYLLLKSLALLGPEPEAPVALPESGAP